MNTDVTLPGYFSLAASWLTECLTDKTTSIYTKKAWAELQADRSGLKREYAFASASRNSGAKWGAGSLVLSVALLTGSVLLSGYRNDVTRENTARAVKRVNEYQPQHARSCMLENFQAAIGRQTLPEQIVVESHSPEVTKCTIDTEKRIAHRANAMSEGENTLYVFMFLAGVLGTLMSGILLAGSWQNHKEAMTARLKIRRGDATAEAAPLV